MIIDIRELFDPSLPASTTVGASDTSWRPRELIELIRGFYKQRLGWLALAVSVPVLVYGGGALMFWYHSILLGEGGPAISPLLHWLVDSTAGLFALTPAIAVIMPIAAAQAVRHTGRLRIIYYGLVGGVLFALATTPGPVLHDNFVGRGTWLANQVTKVWGDGRPLPPTHHYVPTVSMSLQLAFALPVYIVLMWLTVLMIRRLIRTSAERVVDR